MNNLDSRRCYNVPTLFGSLSKMSLTCKERDDHSSHYNPRPDFQFNNLTTSPTPFFLPSKIEYASACETLWVELWEMSPVHSLQAKPCLISKRLASKSYNE